MSSGKSDLCLAPHVGPKRAMAIIADALGSQCPKVNPALSDPGTRLVDELRLALTDMKRPQLNNMLRVLTGLTQVDSPNKAVLRQTKQIVTDLLDPGKEGPHHYLASWKLWPVTLTRREDSKMKKQTTTKKTSSKRIASKKVSKKTSSKKTSSKKSGKKGKPALRKLMRPVVKTSKRGKVLAKFLGPKSCTPDKAAIALATSKSNVLSHLHDIHKYHGIGYELGDGNVKITLPKGCKSPWT